MGTALTLIILACAALLIWAFITGRVSAATRKTYLPQSPSPKDAAKPSDGQDASAADGSKTDGSKADGSKADGLEADGAKDGGSEPQA